MGLGSILTRVVCGLAIAGGATACLAGGGGALNDPQETYSTERIGPERAAAPDEGVNASITIQFVSYALNSVGGKYRLLPLLVRVGARPAALPLAIEQDRLAVMSNGRKIPASFQLSTLDRPLWDSLSAETRKRLTYPDQLSPNSAAVIYAFVPLADLPVPPDGFEYTIKALTAPLLLLPEPKKKAAAWQLELPAG